MFVWPYTVHQYHCRSPPLPHVAKAHWSLQLSDIHVFTRSQTLLSLFSDKMAFDSHWLWMQTCAEQLLGTALRHFKDKHLCADSEMKMFVGHILSQRVVNSQRSQGWVLLLPTAVLHWLKLQYPLHWFWHWYITSVTKVCQNAKNILFYFYLIHTDFYYFISFNFAVEMTTFVLAVQVTDFFFCFYFFRKSTIIVFSEQHESTVLHNKNW